MFKKLTRYIAKYRLIRRYSYLQEVDKLLEEYMTSKILKGGSPEYLSKGRSELIQQQRKMEEQQRLIDFLKTVDKE